MRVLPVAVLMAVCLAQSALGVCQGTPQEGSRTPVVRVGEAFSQKSTGQSRGLSAESSDRLPGQEQENSAHYPIPPPLVYQGIYPCQACHRKDIQGVGTFREEGDPFLGTYIRTANPQPRILVRMHRDIRLKHGNGEFWCLACHNAQERNYLALLNGELISFEDSYRVCGQCHGNIYRDWKIGIHGRRVGQWNGKKLYLLCAHCHNPHDPKFRKLPGMEPPQPPSFGRWEEAHHSGQGPGG